MAMSGGIDSTMASLILHESGYEVIGLTMKTWDYSSSGGNKKETGCCSLDAINDARKLAVDCGFPHTILDIRDEFGDYIIDNFVEEYIAGRTPNPCVLCNTHIKWEALLKRADMLGCKYIATGHYAQLRYENSRYVVSKGLDNNKDQSYVLWGVKQECLARTIFPMGGYHKEDIKKMAISRGYKDLAAKSESYEICFIPDNDYPKFIAKQLNDDAFKQGEIVNSKGDVLGTHQGYPAFTIGQRKGLNLGGLKEPHFVTHIDPANNRITVGTKKELERANCVVGQVTWSLDVKESTRADVQIRYRHQSVPAKIVKINDSRVRVEFDQPQISVAPGQSAVFYQEDCVIGGGWLE